MTSPSPKRLLFLHTGGTLGMTGGSPGPLGPAHYEATVLPFVRGLEHIAHIEGQVVCNLDSTELSPQHWVMLAESIAQAWDGFDGFVVLHGTDTMAYTACALSFMLGGLSKPVVLTGAQRPIAAPRTDARTNLVHSAICATQGPAEVGLFFGDRLFRGNRATKWSIQAYDAFASPNLPPLLRMGVDIAEGAPALQRTGPLRLQTAMATNVPVLAPVPGLPPETLDALADGGAQAVVLRGFGDGNLPRTGYPQAIERLSVRGIPVVVVSQCTRGRLRPGRYECSQAALDAGALYAADLTVEAAAVKTMWLLGPGGGRSAVAEGLTEPVAGECT